MRDCAERTAGGSALVPAAVLSFGFVYIHPFERMALPDLTDHVGYIADIVRVTIEQEMRKEAATLRSLRLARERVKQVIEEPDTDTDRILRSVREHGGLRSRRSRH